MPGALRSNRRIACGDGKRRGGEWCDDGNVVVGDGCSPDCLLESDCTRFGATECAPVCGDGSTDDGEDCDDGNALDHDGCTTDCRLEAGYRAVTDDQGRVAVVPVCGDGIQTSEEGCDAGDDNHGGYNGCTAACYLGPYCGDGIVDHDINPDTRAAYEVCDTGEYPPSSPCFDECRYLNLR